MHYCMFVCVYVCVHVSMCEITLNQSARLFNMKKRRLHELSYVILTAMKCKSRTRECLMIQHLYVRNPGCGESIFLMTACETTPRHLCTGRKQINLDYWYIKYKETNRLYFSASFLPNQPVDTHCQSYHLGVTCKINYYLT